MQISCGTDIIEIGRIKQSIERLGEKFIDTIFTEKEKEYCESHKANKYQHYAARFAAKEALYKALSGIIPDEELTWKNFEIVNLKNGKPEIAVNNEKIKSIDVSISHCKEYAMASVVAIY